MAKSLLIPLGLTAIASVVDEGIHQKITIWNFCIRNNRTNYIKQRSERQYENSYVSRRFWPIDKNNKNNTQTIKNESKEQRDEFFSMLLSILRASLLGSKLAGKEWWGQAVE